MLNIKIKRALHIICISLLGVSLAFNCWLFYQLSVVIKTYQLQQADARILSFADMFVEKVLMANKEIDFDTRLSLETAVRTLNDQQIFDEWQEFTKADTREEASQHAKVLLNTLIKKAKQ